MADEPTIKFNENSTGDTPRRNAKKRSAAFCAVTLLLLLSTLTSLKVLIDLNPIILTRGAADYYWYEAGGNGEKNIFNNNGSSQVLFSMHVSMTLLTISEADTYMCISCKEKINKLLSNISSAVNCFLVHSAYLSAVNMLEDARQKQQPDNETTI